MTRPHDPITELLAEYRGALIDAVDVLTDPEATRDQAIAILRDAIRAPDRVAYRQELKAERAENEGRRAA